MKNVDGAARAVKSEKYLFYLILHFSPHGRPRLHSSLSLNYWLVKSEPDHYGWHHFIEQGRAIWEGVRNYQARNNLKAMKLGDQVLFYHSIIKPGVVGLAKVVQEAYPDPTVEPAQAKFGWVVVDLEPVMVLDKPVSLTLIKAEPLLANISLIRQSRLSVMPVRPDEFELILKMGQKENDNGAARAVMNDNRVAGAMMS